LFGLRYTNGSATGMSLMVSFFAPRNSVSSMIVGSGPGGASK
jgi:hypothetical protein